MRMTGKWYRLGCVPISSVSSGAVIFLQICPPILFVFTRRIELVVVFNLEILAHNACSYKYIVVEQYPFSAVDIEAS